MAGIPFVFTIARVAEMLGEDEDWLHELSITMDPEDGHLWVLDVGEREVPAFTQYGIECLKEIITEEPATNRAPAATVKRRTLRFSPDAYQPIAIRVVFRVAGGRHVKFIGKTVCYTVYGGHPLRQIAVSHSTTVVNIAPLKLQLPR